MKQTIYDKGAHLQGLRVGGMNTLIKLFIVNWLVEKRVRDRTHVKTEKNPTSNNKIGQRRRVCKKKRDKFGNDVKVSEEVKGDI